VGNEDRQIAVGRLAKNDLSDTLTHDFMQAADKYEFL